MTFEAHALEHGGFEDPENSGRMSARASTRKRTMESLSLRTPSLRTKRLREDVGVKLVDASSAFSPSDDSEHSESEPKKTEKGCRCGRTKCLKQYCACFRSDIRCTKDCVCRDCNNDGFHEETRMKAVRMTRLNDPTVILLPNPLLSASILLLWSVAFWPGWLSHDQKLSHRPLRAPNLSWTLRRL
mmetsp:Transcript_102/g.266  ORF Transcript_102/g.266 Transcript_102/m.266 type:complete len:186 (-) Transcript_102:1092-1649(-)